MLNEKKISQALEKQKVLSDSEIQEAVKGARAEKLPLDQYLLKHNVVSESLLYETLAEATGVPFINLETQAIRRDILQLLPEPIVQVHRVVAFEKNAREIKLATLDADDLQTFDFIRKKTGLTPRIFLTTPASITAALKLYHRGLKAEFKEMSQEHPAATGAGGEEKDLKSFAEDLPVVRVVDTLLEYAIFEGASDIHLEPSEGDSTVRYRIDGILRDVMTLPKGLHPGVVARIKILSNLKLDEHRLPQDGRFKISTEDKRIAFRVSILPVFDGEKVVLRLLNESARILTLDQLGLQPKPLEVLKQNIRKPHGMILVTGPTGSGKTTTLYTILQVLNTPGVNISTVEDPVEYRMQRVNQTQVNAKIGLTFANGLRSLLRQDPNIIMVGEIRDAETAEMSTQAALTGHLVLSTLHTNDAVTALPRLRDMKVPNFLIASTTNAVMAQRLVRKICSSCIESYTLNKKAVEDLAKQLNIETVLKALETSGQILSSKQGLSDILFYRGRGCKQCGDTGYRGRIGIYEILEVDKKFGELILIDTSAEGLRAAARAQGMLSMLEDGFIKAKEGQTTIEEVLRVTKE
jgi:type IV pilus assembly protein PilB